MQFGLSESIAHWGRFHPDRPAVITNGKIISYGVLNASVDSVATQLRDDPANRVAVACGPKYDLLVAILATLRAGKSVVLLNTGLSDDALRTNLADANVEVLLHDASSQRVPNLVKQRSGRLIEFATPADGASIAPPNRLPKDEWGVIYSSGTTGTPKGIERDHDSMVTELVGWVIELGLNRDTRFFIGRPIFYTGGLVLAGAALLVCGTIILDDTENDNDPEEAWRSLANALQADEIDWAFFIPDQLHAFIKTGRTPKLARAPKNILVMGGPISGDEKLTVSRLLGCNVIESWGNSESLGTITEAEDLIIRPNSIGRPFLCDDLSIVDEKCRPLPPGEYGRIAGSMEAGFVRYCNRPEATDQARREGLIISDDYGFQDQQGYFYILGRLSDNVVRDGKSIFLSQIERRIRLEHQVGECCVTSVGDEGFVQVVAIVSLTGHADPEVIRARFNVELSSDEKIDRVLLLEIPKLPSGKIDRLACKKLAEDNPGA